MNPLNSKTKSNPAMDALFNRADELRSGLSSGFRDQLVKAIYADAEAITHNVVRPTGTRRWDWDRWLDRVVTSPILGLPIMLLLLTGVFWLTITAANYPS